MILFKIHCVCSIKFEPNACFLDDEDKWRRKFFIIF